jgi:protocatechuate 3,4-dioxygenase beta subunit
MVEHLSDSRRRFLRLMLAAPVLLSAGQLVWAKNAADPTPECGDDDEPTPNETAGPFYKPSSPERTSLIEPGMKGTRLIVTGKVFGHDCKPLAHSLVDFWHADDDGEYDNEGFKLRGHQFTDANGVYRLETIVPGEYPGRTRHIHVRVQPAKGRILTTQMYFPGEARNKRDGLFNPALLMEMTQSDGKRRGGFHFHLDQA